MRTELDKLRDVIVPRRQEPAVEPERLPAPLQEQAQEPVPQGFFTFRYSSTEIYAQGGDLHVKMHQTSYRDGRLQSEECEGTLDRQAYDRVVREAQGYFLNQMVGFTRLLLAPFMPRGRHYDE